MCASRQELFYQYCVHKFKVKEQEINTVKTQVWLIAKVIKLLKVVVAGLQHWGSAVMNIPGAISIMDHTHFRGKS